MRLLSCRSPGLRPFLLSCVVVLTFASKILHILQHLRSVPSWSFFLYLPTFFVSDFLVSIFAWLALSKLSGSWGVAGSVVVAFLGVIDLGAVSSQFGFFYVTGAEVRWSAASSLATDTAGLKLLLSGLMPVFAFGTLLLALCWTLAPLITLIFDSWLLAIGDGFIGLSYRSRKYLPLANEPKQPPQRRCTALFLTVVGFIAILCLDISRPHVPYDHMSGTVPFTVAEALQNKNRTCLSTKQQPFPLSDLVAPNLWEPKDGRYKGWKPGYQSFVADVATAPSWAPETWPVGFGRWADSTNNTLLSVTDVECPGGNSLHHTYDPVVDPMRITNLDLEVLAPVQKALKDHAVPIKHDIFPLKSDSHLYQQIIAAHASASEEDLQELKSRLAAMTPVAEQITGESGNFDLESVELRNNLTAESWKDPSAPGMGGINVLGTVTGSSLSFKSVVGSHCGVGPIPVDFMFETDAEIYQPCIMHILKLFNELKKEGQEASTDMRKQKWRSVFMQSITGEFDNQRKLNEQMGFDQSIFKENINSRSAKHWHEGMKEINYFGYEEPEIYPYLKDTIEEAKANGERLFLSHFTSTTHHPWGLPSEIQVEDYWPHNRFSSEHQPSNKYLNTVHYVDKWLGNVMQIIEEAGIANETLVVFVGDHGQAFAEDSHIIGTFENGHISNFRVPLVFRHPLLPRLEVHANASSMSILPTILDLLINTNSLDDVDKNAASDLIHEYEGQSLLRPYKESHNGRQAWNMGIINTGGTMLSVASAAAPYRLILPLTREFTFIFSDLSQDPNETDVVEDWDFHSLLHTVKRKYGNDAAHWLSEAEKVGRCIRNA
uniref:Lipoteichoic acid synthase-like YqgS n=1 Tax=Talaromyces marneffei PM1 TaxID=1077442 RepID=A0A093V1M7_TALMA